MIILFDRRSGQSIQIRKYIYKVNYDRYLFLLHIYSSLRQFIYLSIYLSIRQFIYLSIYLSIRPYVYLSSIYLYLYPSTI